ncbi:MAG TPA: N4-gp56 family major capsid protein, partial [Burkholderiaceae bacterium]
AGAAVGVTGLFSSNATNIDVYPMIVVGEEGAFDIALRGEDAVKPTHISHKQKDKSDPLGQRGYVGVTFWSAVLVANPGWMAVAEVGTTNTTPA